MASGTKIGLFLVLCVLGAFGYVVYKKMDKSNGLFQGGDEGEKLQVAKAKENPDENDKSNDFGTGTGSGWGELSGFDSGGSGEETKIVQNEPIVQKKDGFWMDDRNSPGGNDGTNLQQQNGFNPGNSGYPFSERQEDRQPDSFVANEVSEEGAGGYFDAQQQPANFDQRGYSGQYGQSETQPGTQPEYSVEQASQQETGLYQQEEMDDENLSDPFGRDLNSGDSGNHHSMQQSDSEQVQYGKDQQFFDETGDGQQLSSESGSTGRQDSFADGSSWERAGYGSNQESEYSQATVEGYVQADQNVRNLFGEETDLNSRNQQTADSTASQTNRYGGYRNSEFNREAARSATTVRHAGEGSSFFNDDKSYRVDRAGVYEIQTGDNYWSISRKQYGTARYFMALSRYNRQRIPDEKRMRPGTKVLIPRPEILESRYPDLFPKRLTQIGISQDNRITTAEGSQPSGFFRSRTGEPLYRVGEENTLSEIAQEHLGRSSRWIQIYKMNRSRLPNPNNLKIGTVLRLPADASNVRLVRNLRDDR